MSGREIITLFVEARGTAVDDERVTVHDAALAGTAWQRELREHDGLRLALRVDARPASVGSQQVDGRIVPLPNYVGVASMVRTLPTMFASIDAAVRQSDVVCAKLPGIIGLIAIARATRHRKPIAVEVVGDIAEVLRAGVAGWVGIGLAPIAARETRRAVRRADAVRYVTQRVLQDRYPPRPGVRTVAYSDVEVWPPTIGNPAERVPGRVIAVGSQEQLYKGHQVLIEAVATLASTDPRVHLQLVGGGRRQPQLRELAASRSIEDRVIFAGHVDDRRRLQAMLDRADVFAMPSLTEGMPRALIEAMSRGLPCIGTDVGGIPEILPADAITAPGDIQGLARLLKRALEDHHFRRQLEGAARDALPQFAPDELEQRRREWSSAVGDMCARSGHPA